MLTKKRFFKHILQSQSQREVRTDLRAILHNAKGKFTPHPLHPAFHLIFSFHFLHNNTNTTEKKHELAAGTGQQVTNILLKAKQFEESIQKPQEEALASEIFALAAQTGHAVAKKLAQGGKSYTPADFVRHLKSHYVNDLDAQHLGASDPSAFNWIALGRRLIGWIRPAPVTLHMLGPMAAAPKAKRPAAQRRQKQVIAAAVSPDEVGQQGEEKQETDRNMEIMWLILKEGGEGQSIPLVELVLNHHSFAQTVENMFALSFMVRDGQVELKDGPDGVMVGAIMKKSKDRAAPRGETERVQFVLTVDFEEWEMWKKVVKESDTRMPHREQRRPSSDGGGGDDDGNTTQKEEQQQRRRGREALDSGDGGDDEENERNAVVNKKRRKSAK